MLSQETTKTIIENMEGLLIDIANQSYYYNHMMPKRYGEEQNQDIKLAEFGIFLIERLFLKRKIAFTRKI